MVTFKILSLYLYYYVTFLFFFNNENENISPPPTNTFIFWTFVAVASSLCPPSAASCARSKLTTLKLRALIGSRCRLRPGTGPARDIQGNLTHGLTRGAVQLRVRPILVWLRARFVLLLFVVKLTCASLMETRQQGEWVPFLTSQTAALLFVSSWSDNELNLSVARATVMTSLWEWRRGKKVYKAEHLLLLMSASSVAAWRLKCKDCLWRELRF